MLRLCVDWIRGEEKDFVEEEISPTEEPYSTVTVSDNLNG